MSANVEESQREFKAKKKQGSGEFDRFVAKQLNFGATDRAKLYQRLNKFLSRGFDLRRALENAYQRFERNKDPRRVIWRDWVRGLQAGRKFNELIAPYVPSGERMLIAAGEDSGALAKAFERAQYIALSMARIKSTLIGELMYPVMLFLVFASLLIVVSMKLMPTMETMGLPVEQWPAVSKGLYHVAYATRAYGIYTAVFMILIGGLSLWSLPRWSHDFRRKLDKWCPPFNIYREIESATLLINCAAMTATGNTVDSTFKSIRANSGPWLAWHMDRFIRGMTSGKMPSYAMDTGLIERETMGDLQDYDDAGAFTEAIGFIGEDIVEATIERIKLQATVLRVLAMLAVAAGLLWTYAGIGLLVMEISNKAQTGV